MAASINVILDGNIIPVVAEVGFTVSQLVKRARDEYFSQLGITVHGGLSAFSVDRVDGEALEDEPTRASPSKVKLKAADVLDTSLFADGAHLILLERKPGEFLGCRNRRPCPKIRECLVHQYTISCFPRLSFAGVVASTLDAAIATAVRAAMEERELFDRMNPFARSHHSDSISLHSAVGATRFPGSEAERVAFKQEVAEFYGLTSLLPGTMLDMFNNRRFKNNVTLAHIWPASYTNWEEPCNELALPEGFHRDPRNFLLLPRDVHTAFDLGRIIFVPSTTHITCYVLPGHHLSKRVRKLHGKALHLPKHDAGGVPYKRQLAYFALRAKGRAVVDASIQASLEAAMSASADASGNAALQELERRMRAINII